MEKNKIVYENVFKAKGALYARTYNTETKEIITERVKPFRQIFIETSKESEYKSVPGFKNLKEYIFKNSKEQEDFINSYKNSRTFYGSKAMEESYIRKNWPKPIECIHTFSNTWFFDIETGAGLQYRDKDGNISKEDKALSKNDWKPTGHERAAMAPITSIQIYDTKAKSFIILGLNKDFKNDNNYTPEIGKIKYINCPTEEELLKSFLKILHQRDPAIMSGWNSENYDIPYITNRIIRVLDKQDNLYVHNKKKNRLVFNTSLLEGGYVSQLSPHAGLVSHREIQTNFGLQDTFSWAGIILEDYLIMYKKYTFVSHTSYSLDTVCEYELGNNKVNHDEFADFTEFYLKDYNTFIEYGIKDVELLYLLNEKLKLMELAQYIAYATGCTMDFIRGTIRQWNSYMFMEHYNRKEVLPYEGMFKNDDLTLINYFNTPNGRNAIDSLEGIHSYEYIESKKDFYTKLASMPQSEQAQTFPGGIVKNSRQVNYDCFSLDFGSLYPSVIQWANIGIDTIILPKDLPEELINARLKYAIYYPKNVDPSELIKYDLEFQEKVINNPKAAEDLKAVLKKYNVSMTPNGMFYKLDRRSVLSELMEFIITERKVQKKLKKEAQKELEQLKKKRELLLAE